MSTSGAVATDVVGLSSDSGIFTDGSTAIRRPGTFADGWSTATSWRSPAEHGSNQVGATSSGASLPHMPSGTTSRAGKVNACDPKQASAACGPRACSAGPSTGSPGQGMVADWSQGVPSLAAAATHPDGNDAAASPGPNGST